IKRMKAICHHLLVCCTFFILCKADISAQKQGQALIDSLLSELPKTKDDTAKVNLLNSLGKNYMSISEFEKGLAHGNSALSLAEKLNFRKGIANAHHNLGMIVTNQGNYNEALKHYDIALKIREEINDQKGIAATTNNMGLVSQSLGRFPFALKMFFRALKINEAIDNKTWMGANYNNIGIVYLIQEKYPEALKNLKAALKICEEIGNRFDMNHPYNNIGNIYLIQGNYTEALKNFEESYKIRLEMGDKFEIANIVSNIGLALEKQGKYSEATKKFEESFKISNEIGDKTGIAAYYNNMGELNILLKNYSDARKQIEKGIALNKETGSIEGLKNLYSTLTDLDSATGYFNDAYHDYKKYIIYKDSLINEENAKQLVEQQMQYDFDKKDAVAKAEQDKKDAVAKKELQKQKLVRNGFVGGFAIVLLFAGVVFTQRNKIKKGKKRSDELLLNILPAETAEELKATGTAAAKDFDEVTVIFTDFKDFTQASENMSAHELVNEIHYYFSEFDKIISKHNIEKIKTIGDSYMAAGGLPTPNKTNAIDTVTAALEIQSFMDQIKQQKQNENKVFFDIRIGVNTGPVIAGIVGIKKFAYDIWGDTVNIASRMESSGEEGKVNISGATYELIKEKFHCTYRGKVLAKHKGEIDMYFVEG
ncbi:MAG TPA: adenylate/guanylate cyclase domain-containing protein, partial [Chitinophagaceae bacterium]|nr:adenylate/guanylate cyclase domain-containing protein [Chitinophagaceae bacterium]